MDAARTALRMDAKEVTVVYHRSIENMSALRAEYDDAVNEGVRFMWNSSITEIRGENGIIKEVSINSEGEEIVLPADRIVMAVGSQPASRIVSTTEGIKVDGKGYVLTRETPYGMTSRKGVFAGGDVTNRPATVVHAMQDARKVSDGIMQYVDALKLMSEIDSKEI